MSLLLQQLSKSNQINKFLIPSLLTLKSQASFNKISKLRLSSMPLTKKEEFTLKATHLDSETSPETAEILKENSKYLLPLYSRPDIIFSHGQGCYLYDLAGRAYLDCSSGIAVNAFGHNDADILKAINEQAQQIIHISNLYHNENPGKLAKMIVEGLENKGTFANGGKVFFGNSGTEANEAAIKFARRYGKTIAQDKDVIISFNHAFHGRSLGALSATPNPKYQDPFTPLLPGFKYSPYNDLEAALKNIDEKVCGVIVEVVQGEGGLTPIKKEFLEGIRKRCDEVNALLIYDEIQTGLGRTGKLYAHQNYNITPDIMTLAKPLAGGIPIGATVMTDAVAKTIKLGDHGTTFGGNALATHVGQVVFKKIYQPEFLKSVQEKGEYMKNALKQIAENSPIVKEVRGMGLMIGMELVEGVTPASLVGIARQQGLLVITAGLNTLRILPPLIISKQEIDQAVEIIANSIKYLETLI